MMKKIFVLCCVVAALAQAQCVVEDIVVKNEDELTVVLKTAHAGMNISLLDGVYKGTFYMTSTGRKDCPISIFSQNPGKASVVPWPGTSGFKFDDVSYINIRDIEIHGGYYGFLLSDSNHINLQNLYLHDAREAGIFLSGVTDTLISNCTFEDIGSGALNGGYGIMLGSAYSAKSKNNIITSCTFGDSIVNGDILVDTTAEECRITGNLFGGNNCEYTNWIRVGGTKNLIAGNYFVSADKSALTAGISALGTENVYQKNTFKLGNSIFAIYNRGKNEHVCSSNKVVGGMGLTNDVIDQSC